MKALRALFAREPKPAEAGTPYAERVGARRSGAAVKSLPALFARESKPAEAGTPYAGRGASLVNRVAILGRLTFVACFAPVLRSRLIAEGGRDERAPQL